MILQSKFLKCLCDHIVRKSFFFLQKETVVLDYVCQTLYQRCEIDEYKDYIFVKGIGFFISEKKSSELLMDHFNSKK